MPLSQNHKIHTISLQVDFEGMEVGLGVQDSIGLFFHEKIKPALDKAFDQCGDPNKTLVIEKLELDCGNLPTENWENVLLKRVFQQVEEAMNAPQSNNYVSVSIEKKANEVFFYFLQKGFFPWNSPFSSPKELEKEIALDGDFLKNLKENFHRSSVFSDRLFKSFSAEFISKIFESLPQNSNNQVGELVKYLHTKSIVQNELMQVLLPLQNQNSLTYIAFLKILISHFSKENLHFLADYLNPKMVREKEIREGLKSLISERSSAEFQGKLKMTLEIMRKKDPKILKKSGITFEEIDFKKTGIPQQTDLKKSQFSADFLERKNAQESEILPKNQIDLGEEIFIENAGMVVFHPFLEGLFDNLHLINNRNFVGIQEQFIAAQILQFLVIGENEHSENFFPLNKILCGIGLNDVLDLDIDLSQESKIECEEMLKDVIGHWSVLKNTSVEGLRETFLQRNGKLTKVEKGWKLQVERKTVDVLLAKLPWGMGIIKLPWMTEMIFVEWD